jgi:hypothetical protein
MDKHTAACVIQRWFRSKFAKKECVISHSNFISLYEITVDKQSYDANQLLMNVRHSSFVPHSRREITDSDIEQIHEKYDPFGTTRKTYRRRIDDNDDVNGCSPRPPISFVLNKASILCVQ